MLGNLKQLADLMRNAGSIREKADELKRELERKSVTGESGGGAVRVTMTGKGRVTRVELDPNLLLGIAGSDKAIAEDLIAAAANDAVDKVQRLIADEVRAATGGLDIPGLGAMLGNG